VRGGILAFVAGVCWLQQQAALPAPLWLAAACLTGLALVLASVRWRGAPKGRLAASWVGMALLGIAFAAWRADLALSDALAAERDGEDVTVTGIVDSLPARSERSVRFEFALERPPPGVPGRVILSWYDETRGAGSSGAALRPGQRWELTVRLRRPHGNANPHGFDYEVWLLEQGVRATGTVRPLRAGPRRLLDAFVWRPSTAIDRLRANLRDRIEQTLAGKPYAGVITALVIGDQRGIDQDDWALFNRTGVGHLVSISGLHVTMIAAAVAWLVLSAWRRLRWRGQAASLQWPAPAAAACAGAAAALLYCLLAGWGVPAQRTFFMLLVVACALWTGRLAAATHVLAAALFLVVLFDPWAVLAAGFWLSFGAVALIFYASHGRMPLRAVRWRGLREAARVQAAITLGLAPFAVLLFHQISIVGPLANAIAIPVVSFVVTPLALLGSGLAAFWPAPWLLEWAHGCFAGLMVLLRGMDAWPMAAAAVPAPPLWAFVAAVIGMLWCLAPRAVPGRLLGLAWMLPLFLLPPPRPGPGEVWLTALDVGQGTAVLVETAQRRLLYDTGPPYGADSDAGGRVILPYLRARGIGKLDGLIVSHADQDHVGGAESVLDGVPVDWTASSLDEDHAVNRKAARARRCFAGQSWEWDGIRFSMLHPTWDSYAHPAKTNARSCVLHVQAGARGVLLAGDIEAPQEAQLVRDGQALGADVLLVPHHGSKTSSTAAFLDAVQPRLAVFQVGHRNRYGHPRADVVARYVARGAEVLRTDEGGAISVRLTAHAEPSVGRYREERKRYWHLR
jgi:competence protein ComEC